MGDDGPRAIDLLPVGAYSRDLLRRVARHLSRRVQLTCRVLEADPGLPMHELPSRAQIDADRLLTALEERAAPDGRVLVGLLAHDMGTPVFTHFFGRARRDGPAALVSTARLDPRFQGRPADLDLTARRAAREILHELGHVAGLGHCRRWDCLMRFAATVEDADNRGERFCPRCADRLPPALLGAPAPR